VISAELEISLRTVLVHNNKEGGQMPPLVTEVQSKKL